MRTGLLLSVLVFLSGFAYCQDDNEIYSKVINDYVLKLKVPNFEYSSPVTLTILEKPAYLDSLGVSDFTRFKKKYKDLEQQTFIDFVEKNLSTLQLDTLYITGIEVVLLSNESIPSRKELRSHYPNRIPSILELSNIGYNDEGTQALVYYGFNSGPSTAGGIYIVYEKKRSKWKQKGFIPAWTT